MIIPIVFGGVGNQLFCYAAARRLSIVNAVDLAIDNVTGFRQDKYSRKYTLHRFNIPCRLATAKERLEPFPRIRRKFLKVLSSFQSFESRTYIQQEGNDFDCRLLRVVVSKTTYLEGYWQSADYFSDVEAQLRRELRPKPPEDTGSVALGRTIESENVVALHVRYFDPPGVTTRHNLDREYYRRALMHLERSVGRVRVALFSDNTTAAREMLGLPSDQLMIVSSGTHGSSVCDDLWLMTKCRHFIIANSTFSWWAAWLGEKENSEIVAPNIVIDHPGRLTSWGFNGLIPQKWKRL